MKYLLDTNSCIYLFVDAYPALTRRVADQPSGSLGISAISYAEIAYGSQTGRPPLADTLAGFVEEVAVLPLDGAAGDVYGRLPFKRANFDRLIAAHALSLGLTLVTRNLSDFAGVPGLVVEDWTR